jgi:hypothetical protein
MTRRFLPALLLLTGCAFRTATVALPEPLAVTHVAVRAGSNEEDTQAAYERTRKMLRTKKHPEAQASVSVDLGTTDDYLSFLRQDGIALWFLIWPMLGGMVTHREHVGVDVVVTSHGRLLRGHGEAEKQGSIYAPAQKRALAVALGRAIRDAYAH